MKYFNPNYWFKLWLLSAPLFNDETKGINAKSINNNEKIKSLVSKNISSLDLINQNSITNQPYSLLNQSNQSYLDLQNYERNLHLVKNEYQNKNKTRDKRQLKNNKNKSRRIYTIPNDYNLIISSENANLFVSSFESIIIELAENDILRAVYRNPDNPNSFNQQIFTLNDLRYGYFNLPVQLRWEQNGQSHSRNLRLVFRVDNLYLEGFLIDNNYYHFNFELQSQRYRNQYGRGNYQRIEHLTNIENYNSISLVRIGPDYRYMIPGDGERIYWSNIFDSFFQLTQNFNPNNEELATSLGRIILTTSESLRFRNIFNIVNNILINRDDGGFITLNMNPNEHNWYSEDSYGITGGRNNIYRILINWASLSQPTGNINRVDQNVRWLLENYHNWETNVGVANIFSYVINERDNRVRTEDQIFNQVSLEEITWALQSNPIRILLGAIILRRINGNCNNRLIRQIKNNNYWNEEFCKFKPEIDKIKGEAKLTKIIDNYNKDNILNIGDIYIGTTNGLYLLHRSSKIVYKADNINDEEVTSIKNFAKNKFYATTKNGDVYFLRTDRIASDSIFFGEILSNFESSDLNKELKLYYNNDQSSKFVNYDWYNINKYCNRVVANFDLKNINPIDNYQKIDFFGDKSDIDENRISWGNTPYYSDKKIYDFNQLDIKGNNILNIKTPNNNDCKFESSPSDYNLLSLQKYKTEWWGGAFLDWLQTVGLTWNWESKKYTLKIHTSQYGHTSGSTSEGTSFLSLGKGIRLYNDNLNTNSKQKREIKNENQWNNDYSKSINNEQNLPIINNTNFVKNNITSL